MNKTIEEYAAELKARKLAQAARIIKWRQPFTSKPAVLPAAPDHSLQHQHSAAGEIPEPSDRLMITGGTFADFPDFHSDHPVI